MKANAGKLRILMSADTIGGVWTYAMELAQALRPHARVHLAALGRRCTSEQRRAARDVGCVLYESAYKVEWMEDPWQDLHSAAAWLRTLDRRIRPDIVHLNHYAHGDLDWSAPVLTVAHSDVYTWWRAVHHEYPPRSWRRYLELVRKGLRAADTVIAPTQAMLDALCDVYGPMQYTAVIPNARNGGFPIAPKQPIVLSAGRLWDQAKNTHALCQVAPHVRWPVFLAGEGKTGTAKNLNALGLLPSRALHQWMACASIYVLPARYEPFGLSALEAARCGCALVLGDIPSLREVWGEAAKFVPPGDEDALLHTLNHLAEKPALRQQMAERARIHAQRYQPGPMVEAYLEQYGRLLPAAHPAIRASAKVSA